jgi:Cu/Ag efflux protein CusF
MGFVAAGLLMLAPISMAAGTAGEGTGSTTSPGAGTTQSGPHMQQPGQGSMSQQSGHLFHATIESIDPNDRTVQLRPEGGGETIEMKVPQKEVLSGLKKGDRVQVSLQKAAGGTSGGTPSSGLSR